MTSSHSEGQQWTHYNWSHVATDAHKQLAVDAARQSLVLLQNPNNVLPLARTSAAGAKKRKMLVAGPLFDATKVMLGNYNGEANSSFMPPLWQAIANVSTSGGGGGGGGNVYDVVANGAFDDACDVGKNSTIPAVVAAAKDADVVVLVLGGDCHEGEGTDRDFLHLPGAQSALFTAVNAIPGVEVVVVLINGGPIAIDEIKPTNAAVISAGFPGQAGGQVIGEALFGLTNPSGKTTTTIYPGSYANGEPVAGMPWMDPAIRPHDGTQGRTYMYYTGTPLYPFGYGLSYTTFSLGFAAGSAPEETVVQLSDLAAGFGRTVYAVVVTNTGKVPGKETVMAYWSPPDSVDPLLQKQLFAFDGVYLEPGASATLQFALPEPAKIATITENGDRIFDRGTYTVTFSRGHGAELAAYVSIDGMYVDGPVLLSKFPSQWSEGHEVAVDACVEGTSDVVPHTEAFLVDYKRWAYNTVSKNVQHVASGMCLTAMSAGAVSLWTCGASGTNRSQAWNYDAAAKSVTAAISNGCLTTGAANASMLRVNVTVAPASAAAGGGCKLPAAHWVLDVETGFFRSGIEGLCLAATSYGVFNTGS